jgi:hypothetical protein
MAEVITTTEQPTLPPAAAAPELPVARPIRAPLSWGAIFGGAVTALGVWLLLDVFGLALGLSRIDPSAIRNMRPWGIFVGVWSAITPLIALFVGGWVAGRGAGFLGRPSGAMHGLVVWGLTSLAGAAAFALVAAALIGGAASIGQAAIRAGGEAVGALAPSGGVATAYLGLDANQALAPVNARLMAEGKTPVQAGELQRATTDVFQSAMASGRLDHEALVGAVASSNPGLSPADAEQIADRLEAQFAQRVAAVQAKAEAAARSAKTGVLTAARTSGRALWGLFGSLLLSLIAALAGGTIGGLDRLDSIDRRIRRERAPATRTTTHVTTAPPREVYP